MIDIETTVFNTVAPVLREAFPGIYVTSEAAAVPASSPAAMLVEMDNSTYIRALDLTGEEKHAQVMYQVEIYSNTTQKKRECKDILSVVDGEMQKMGFVRVGSGPVVFSGDSKSHRIVARYRAVVDKNGTTYRAT